MRQAKILALLSIFVRIKTVSPTVSAAVQEQFHLNHPKELLF